MGVHQITMKYELGGTRRRNLGLGLLTGSALEGGSLIEDIQSNLQFRLNSAMKMVSGDSSMRPATRRQRIMKRRRQLINDRLSGDGSESSSESSSRSRSRGSGRISTTGGSGTKSPSNMSDTPSMSDVNIGTKARAEERGFDG